jgi:hypothetical protein
VLPHDARGGGGALGLGECARLGQGLRQRAPPRSVLANLYRPSWARVTSTAASRGRARVRLDGDSESASAQPSGARTASRIPSSAPAAVPEPLRALPAYHVLMDRGEAHSKAFLVAAEATASASRAPGGRTRKEADELGGARSAARALGRASCDGSGDARRKRARDPRRGRAGPLPRSIASMSSSGQRAASGGICGVPSQASSWPRLVRRSQNPGWVVASTDAEARSSSTTRDLRRERRVLARARGRAGAPGRRGRPEEPAAAPADHAAARGRPERRPRVVVASILSLLQPVPSPRISSATTPPRCTRGSIPRTFLERLRTPGGYTRAPLAEKPGKRQPSRIYPRRLPFACRAPAAHRDVFG